MTSPHFVCHHCGGSGEIVGFGAKVRAARIEKGLAWALLALLVVTGSPQVAEAGDVLVEPTAVPATHAHRVPWDWIDILATAGALASIAGVAYLVESAGGRR